MTPVYAGFLMSRTSIVTSMRALAMPRRSFTESNLARRRTSLPTTLLLMDGADLLGSVSLLIEVAPALQDRGSPWLGSLFVLPAARGRGGGRILVDAAVAHTAREGVALLRLFTLWHEDFYASLGWQVEERTSLHGTPVVIMSIRPARRVAHTRGPAPEDDA